MISNVTVFSIVKSLVLNILIHQICNPQLV